MAAKLHTETSIHEVGVAKPVMAPEQFRTEFWYRMFTFLFAVAIVVLWAQIKNLDINADIDGCGYRLLDDTHRCNFNIMTQQQRLTVYAKLSDNLENDCLRLEVSMRQLTHSYPHAAEDARTMHVKDQLYIQHLADAVKDNAISLWDRLLRLRRVTDLPMYQSDVESSVPHIATAAQSLQTLMSRGWTDLDKSRKMVSPSQTARHISI